MYQHSQVKVEIPIWEFQNVGAIKFELSGPHVMPAKFGDTPDRVFHVSIWITGQRLTDNPAIVLVLGASSVLCAHNGFGALALAAGLFANRQQ